MCVQSAYSDDHAYVVVHSHQLISMMSVDVAIDLVVLANDDMNVFCLSLLHPKPLLTKNANNNEEVAASNNSGY